VKRDTSTGRIQSVKQSVKGAKTARVPSARAQPAKSAGTVLRGGGARRSGAGSALRAAEPRRPAGTKRSVSMPDDLAEQVDQLAGPGRFSAYVARAVERQVALDRLAAYVNDVETELGRPISPELMAEAEVAWHAE
jgi:hypothetical protein